MSYFSQEKPLLVVLTGPTGAGKTDLAIELALYFKTCIIGADSRQFYKELKIGTAPPSNEQLLKVQHYFIQFLSIHEYYNVSKYEQEVNVLLQQLFQNQKIVFLVGGSGLYIDAVIKGIDDMPDVDLELRNSLNLQFEQYGIAWLRAQLQKLDFETYRKIDLSNKNRILRAVEVCLQTGKPYSSFLKRQEKTRPYKILKIAIDIPREQLYQRINQRVDKMIKMGLIDEAQKFFKFKDLVALKTVGYKELFNYFEGKISQQEAIELIKSNTRKYARKQLTWFRRDKDYHWIGPSNMNFMIQLITQSIE
ncbi:MAG: tRNA (adenosine(37)-N6)-dimethylallyltransferase MiaA [Bacteroidales bacterium]|nr:tRNA (adenosine(37)-N6)-dimethylallyltransferase MiaA [Bacteroidales bacterium]